MCIHTHFWRRSRSSIHSDCGPMTRWCRWTIDSYFTLVIIHLALIVGWADSFVWLTWKGAPIFGSKVTSLWMETGWYTSCSLRNSNRIWIWALLLTVWRTLILLATFGPIHNFERTWAFWNYTVSSCSHLITLRKSSVSQVLCHGHWHFWSYFLSKLSLLRLKWHIAVCVYNSLLNSLFRVDCATMNVCTCIQWRCVSYLVTQRSLGK